MSKLSSDTLVACVVFKSVEPYLGPYFHSINTQSDKNFDLLIVVDNYEDFAYEDPILNYEVIYVHDKITPASIRMMIVQYAIAHSYMNLIFSDADDYYSVERIHNSKMLLKDYDFYFNDFSTVDLNNNTLQTNVITNIFNFHNPISINDILTRNIIGLSNSAMNVTALINIYIPAEIIAVDWWLYSILLLNDCRGIFQNKAMTFYRQSPINLVGLNNKLTASKLELGCRVKEIHYRNMVEYCSKNKLVKIDSFKNNLLSVQDLKSKLEDNAFREQYINVVNKNYGKIYSGWWSDIIGFNEWRKYCG